MTTVFLLILVILSGCVSKTKYVRDLDACKDELNAVRILADELETAKFKDGNELEFYRKMFRDNVMRQESVDPMKK